MINTFPSLQDTFAKRTKQTLQPNFAKEPFRPSRLKDRLIDKINRQCPTANKSHRLLRTKGDTNIGRFFVSFQTKLKAMQRLRLLLATH
jgi:hypothetical protein